VVAVFGRGASEARRSGSPGERVRDYDLRIGGFKGSAEAVWAARQGLLGPDLHALSPAGVSSPSARTKTGSRAGRFLSGGWKYAETNLRSGLGEFVSGIRGRGGAILAGIYVPEVLALPVMQQPASRPDFVSDRDSVVTQFQLADDRGTIGLLAHNALSGSLFHDLERGDEVFAVFGDGRIQVYRITAIRRFQALSPHSPHSNFVDLDVGGDPLSAVDLFSQIYDQRDWLVFQTCIERRGEDSWGRLFVIAAPLAPF
jgi:hypothetical protein